MTLKNTARLALSAACALAISCGDGADTNDDSLGFNGSCNESSGAYCIDYTGSAWTVAAVQVGCNGASETYSSDHCSTSGIIGSCTTLSGGDGEYITYYYEGDAASLEMSCGNTNGTWSAP